MGPSSPHQLRTSGERGTRTRRTCHGLLSCPGPCPKTMELPQHHWEKHRFRGDFWWLMVNGRWSIIDQYCNLNQLLAITYYIHPGAEYELGKSDGYIGNGPIRYSYSRMVIYWCFGIVFPRLKSCKNHCWTHISWTKSSGHWWLRSHCYPTAVHRTPLEALQHETGQKKPGVALRRTHGESHEKCCESWEVTSTHRDSNYKLELWHPRSTVTWQQ